jgi:hypothetical protein
VLARGAADHHEPHGKPCGFIVVVAMNRQHEPTT